VRRRARRPVIIAVSKPLTSPARARATMKSATARREMWESSE
jgi:hypothetical protein